jgi:hypothetical protein
MLWRDQRFELRPQPLHRAVLRRIVLRRAARRYALHHWDVIPGACLSGTRFDCGQPGCPTTACHPARADWDAAASHDPCRIGQWWRRLPHGVLLATGRAFDVLELSGTVGTQIAAEIYGPVAVAPPGRWMFLVRAGGALRPELADHSAVVLHRLGSWIPAPPTRLPTGRVYWDTAPDECGWHLPEPDVVQRSLMRALRLDRRPPKTARSQVNSAA